MKSTIRAFCRVLLLAVSVSALTAGIASAQDNLSDLNNQILDNPQDVSLNLRYAQAAEAAGKPRLALAAYERILINDPNNQEARRGYERVRRALEPGYTVTRVEVGVRSDSDPLNLRDGPDATTYFATATLVDERTLGPSRWRTILNAAIENTPDIDILNYGYFGAQTGPIIYLSPHTALLPSIGGAISELNGEQYFSETNVGLTLEGRGDGFSYWWRTRFGWRDYGEGFTAEDGTYAEMVAGFSKPNLFSSRDALIVTPFVRWSDIDGSVFDFFTFSEVSPGHFFEYGLDANYNYQLTDHVLLTAGAMAREREFHNANRSDVYLAPSASVTFQNILPCTCDLKARYQHRDNDSDDAFATYDADQWSLSLIARF